MNLTIGDQVTTKVTKDCYYYNYPKGRNLIRFEPGMIGVIAHTKVPCVMVTGNPQTFNCIDFKVDEKLYRCALWTTEIVLIN